MDLQLLEISSRWCCSCCINCEKVYMLNSSPFLKIFVTEAVCCVVSGDPSRGTAVKWRGDYGATMRPLRDEGAFWRTSKLTSHFKTHTTLTHPNMEIFCHCFSDSLHWFFHCLFISNLHARPFPPLGLDFSMTSMMEKTVPLTFLRENPLHSSGWVYVCVLVFLIAVIGTFYFVMIDY